MATYDMDATASFSGTTDVAAQGLVEAMTGIVLPRNEAKSVLERIPDHKWLLSEQLGRDVGLKVAAMDLVENFYGPGPNSRFGIFASKAWNVMKAAFVRYVTARGNAMPL
ncbi:MAG: hypothetical protein ABIR33_02240 [Pyrinomonadaceae bacterium]